MVEDAPTFQDARPVRVARRQFLALAAALIGCGGRLIESTFGARLAAAQDVTTPDITAATPGPTALYFAEEGHNLGEPFRSRWEQSGGEVILGRPLSEERYASGAGGVLQTFNNLTLLYDPTADRAAGRARAAPRQVRLGRAHSARGPTANGELRGGWNQLPVLPRNESYGE